jgi:phosphoribosylformylglycinamidine cyclo-ligase
MDDERLGRPLGDVLLEPTTIYVRAILELLGSDAEVRGLAHITGDGLNNLLRLSRDVGYSLTDPLPVPAIFDLIQELGGVAEEEMYEVFNMGLGFVCVVPDADADASVALLAKHHPGTQRVGAVTAEAGVVDRG